MAFHHSGPQHRRQHLTGRIRSGQFTASSRSLDSFPGTSGLLGKFVDRLSVTEFTKQPTSEAAITGTGKSPASTPGALWTRPRLIKKLHASNEMAMPGAQCVGRQQAGDFVERGSYVHFCFGGQASPIVVRRTKATALGLSFEKAVLCDNIASDGLPVAMHPAGERHHVKLKLLDVVHGPEPYRSETSSTTVSHTMRIVDHTGIGYAV